MEAEVTVPSRILRRLGRCWIASSAICLLELGLGRLDLPLPQDGVEASHLFLNLAQPAVVVELSGDVLEAEVEELLLRVGQAREQLVVVELAELGGRGHTISSDRVTNLALIGS